MLHSCPETALSLGTAMEGHSKLNDTACVCRAQVALAAPGQAVMTFTGALPPASSREVLMLVGLPGDVSTDLQPSAPLLQLINAAAPLSMLHDQHSPYNRGRHHHSGMHPMVLMSARGSQRPRNTASQAAARPHGPHATLRRILPSATSCSASTRCCTACGYVRTHLASRPLPSPAIWSISALLPACHCSCC